MNVVVFEPHLDDLCLFAAYTALRLKPTVITVLGDASVQEQYGISKEDRQIENAGALNTLGITEWLVWNHSDVNPYWEAVKDDMWRYADSHDPTEAWVPLWEVGGHDQHNTISEIAFFIFADRCRFYATYRRGSGRTHTENEVTPEPSWPAIKFKAMSAYASQINLENCRPWFAADDALREWIA